MSKTTKTPRQQPTPTRMKSFIGYTRVSTEGQATEGFSLEAQEDMIRAYVQKKRAALAAIYSEPASASSAGSHMRPELQCAIAHARRTGFPFIVASMDRLSRNLDVLRSLQGLTIISADKGRISQTAMHALISRAAREADEISRRAKEGHAKRKSRGAVLGNAKSLPKAQRKGCLGNISRCDGNVRAIGDFLSKHPETETLCRKKLAEMLNAADVHNVQSLRKGRSSPWTPGSLTKPLKKARAERLFQTELDAAEETDALAAGRVFPSESAVAPERTCAVDPIAVLDDQSGRLGAEAPVGFEQEVVRVAPKAVGSSQRRSLTSEEARELLRIMRARGIKQKHVMDELGLKRMNPSIWLSCRGGTKVDPEVIMRLERWLQSNAAAPS